MTMPAVVVSHIMLESYKKYVLIWLIFHGDKTQDALTFPKYTSPVVSKYIKPLCAPYHEVIKAFYSRLVHFIKFTYAEKAKKCDCLRKPQLYTNYYRVCNRRRAWKN